MNAVNVAINCANRRPQQKKKMKKQNVYHNGGAQQIHQQHNRDRLDH
jgi:hypothetical protein